MSEELKTYRVNGICFVPTEAEAVVQAESPEQAVEIAQELFKKNRRRLVLSNSGDENAAFDWEPFAHEAVMLSARKETRDE